MSPPNSQRGAPDGRSAAVDAVTAALTGEQFASEVVRGARTAGVLASPQAGLALEIAQGALRHLVTIEHILGATGRYHRQRTPPRLRAVLYTAVYQLVWLDRVPVYAAVDEAVQLAQRKVHQRAGGMANALLRQVADAIVQRRCAWQRLDPAQVRVDWDQACQFNVTVLPEPTEPRADAYLAAATGQRLGRHADLVERYGIAEAEGVGWAAQAVPVTVLQRNTQRLSEHEFRAALQQVCGDQVEFAEEAAFVAADQPIVDTPVFRDGGVYVQDVTARAATLAVAARPGERVLDLCAAPGGKSVALALALRDDGVVWACDASAERLARVADNVRRMKLRCIHPRVWAEGEPPDERLRGLDAALVDAPCSNTGVIARRPEARLRFAPTKLRALVTLQLRLLHKAAACVRPGGRLVYSTCSIEPEENERVVAAFLAERPEWRLDIQRLTLPSWGPWRSDWRDGGYFARFLRST